MKKIKKLVDLIDDEICSAKNYAECYVDRKAKDDSTWASRYKEMATDELKHAVYLHDLATQEIEQLNKVFVAPQEMQDEWDKSHKKYVDRVSWVKQMLAM